MGLASSQLSPFWAPSATLARGTARCGASGEVSRLAQRARVEERGCHKRKGPPRRERPLSILHRNVWENTQAHPSPGDWVCHPRAVRNLKPADQARYLSGFSPAETFAASQRAMRPRPDQVSPVLGSRYFTAALILRRPPLPARLPPPLPLPPCSSASWRRSPSIFTCLAPS